MVAIIPVEMYERLIAERETRLQVLDRIRGRLPEVPPEEVERDVAEAVEAVRAPTRGRIRSCGGRTGGAILRTGKPGFCYLLNKGLCLLGRSLI